MTTPTGGVGSNQYQTRGASTAEQKPRQDHTQTAAAASTLGEEDEDLEAIFAAAVTATSSDASATRMLWQVMPEEEVLHRIAAGMSDSELRDLAATGNAKFNRQIALHPATPAPVLSFLADRDSNPAVLAAVLQNTNTPEFVKVGLRDREGIELLAGRSKERRQTAIDSGDPALLSVLSYDTDLTTAKNLARNPAAPPEALRRVADVSLTATVYVHSNPSRTPGIVNDMARNGSQREMSSFDPMVEDDNRLLDADARVALVLDSGTPWTDHAYEYFAHDPDPAVRAGIAARLSETHERETVFLSLADDPDPQVQAALQEAVQEMMKMHSTTVQGLKKILLDRRARDHDGHDHQS